MSDTVLRYTYKQLRAMNDKPRGQHYPDHGICSECKTDKANAELTGGCYSDCTLQLYVDLANLPVVGSESDKRMLAMSDAEFNKLNYYGTSGPCCFYQSAGHNDSCRHCGHDANKHLYCNESVTRRVAVYCNGRVQHEQLICDRHLDRIVQSFAHPSDTVVVTMVVGNDRPTFSNGQPGGVLFLKRSDQPTCGVEMIAPSNNCRDCGVLITDLNEFARSLVETETPCGDQSWLICDKCRAGFDSCINFESPPADVENGPSQDDLICENCGQHVDAHK